jgi:hypothetical protein
VLRLIGVVRGWTDTQGRLRGDYMDIPVEGECCYESKRNATVPYYNTDTRKGRKETCWR